MPLVEQIKSELEERGWKPATLAQRSGVSPVVISRLLNGSANIKIESLQKIWDCLSISLPSQTENTPPASTSQEIALLNITHRINELADRIKRQGNALEIARSDASSALQSVNDISQRLNEYADTKDLRRLKKAG